MLGLDWDARTGLAESVDAAVLNTAGALPHPGSIPGPGTLGPGEVQRGLPALPVLGPVEIRRALAHEVMAGDGEMVEAIGLRYSWHETGRHVLPDRVGPPSGV